MTSSRTQEGMLAGKRVALIGRLSSMKREQAVSFLEMVGAIFDRAPTEETHYVVVGEGASTLSDEGHPPAGLRAAHELRAAGCDIQVVSETQFLAFLGLEELLRLYTSQQLTRILGIARRELDSWVRRGLIHPVKIVNRLHYFDFAQVVSAKRLQDLIASGVPLARIRSSLEELEAWLPGAGRSLVQLGVLERDGRLIVRLPDGSIAETSGQLQIPLQTDAAPAPGRRVPDDALRAALAPGSGAHDDALRAEAAPGRTAPDDALRADVATGGAASPTGGGSAESHRTWKGDAELVERAGRRRPEAIPSGGAKILPFPGTARPGEETAAGTEAHRSREAEGWFEEAIELEEAGRLEDAVAAYQKALAVDGPAADVSFNLGNVLYTLGRKDEAIQRFLQSVEIDPSYLEAWNNIGTAYFENREPEAAIRALRKALAIDPTYADAHYNLGEVLHFLGRDEEARAHWAAYLRQDPTSDWADHVRQRLRDLNR